MSLPECYKPLYKDAPPVETYVIPVNTILYCGSRAPIKEENMRNGKSRYMFYTKSCDVAIGFATEYGRTPSGFVTKYRVKKPITIFLQRAPFDQYYFDTRTSYSSEEAQCLCQDDFHGYASFYKKPGSDKEDIEDIGLCNVYDGGYLERVMIYRVTRGTTSCKNLSGGKRRTIRNKTNKKKTVA